MKELDKLCELREAGTFMAQCGEWGRMEYNFFFCRMVEKMSVSPSVTLSTFTKKTRVRRHRQVAKQDTFV